MSLTKKDFEIIAEELKFNNPQYLELRGEKKSKEDFQWEKDVRVVADALKRINPRFDYSKFFRAVGIPD